MTREEQLAKIMAVDLLPPDHYANLRPVTEEEMKFQGDPFRAIEEAVVAAHGHDPKAGPPGSLQLDAVVRSLNLNTPRARELLNLIH